MLYLKCGYACINTTIPSRFRTFRKAAIEDKEYSKIDEIVVDNFRTLLMVLRWNIQNNIYMFRISSSLIPFLNSIPMLDYIEQTDMYNRLGLDKLFSEIKNLVTTNNVELSLHLIEYTQINSDNEYTMLCSYTELLKQCELLHKLGGKNIVMHAGGLYNRNPEYMLDRLGYRLQKISDEVDLKNICIENDDKTYTASQVKDFAKKFNLGWCFDYHHYMCNKDNNIKDTLMDYNPSKYHLSTGRKGRTDRTHADYIDMNDLLDFLTLLISCDIKYVNVIFEAKMKEQSILQLLKPTVNGYWKI